MQPLAGQETSTRLEELRSIVRSYRERYGELAGMVDVEKAQATMAVRTRRLSCLNEEAERIKSDIDSMNSEVRRIERWVEFCLEDVIARTKRDHRDGWSPQPVLGFRLWWVSEEALHGVKMPWSSSTLVATCLSRRGPEEIPHSDGRCGRLGCGVYAAKAVKPLYTEFDIEAIDDLAVGLVALTGKVVEHDTGYRAAEATVIALGATMGDRLLLTSDPDRIDEIIADPTVIKMGRRVESSEQRLAEMESFVKSEARRAGQWILGNNNE
jgi:hypothetical protein